MIDQHTALNHEAGICDSFGGQKTLKYVHLFLLFFLTVKHDSSRKLFSSRDKETFEMQNETQLGPGRKPVRNGLESEAEAHIPATHTVRRITEEFRSKHIPVIKLPSQSPELNPV